MNNRNIFRRHRTSLAITLALLASAGVDVAHAGVGWGDSADALGAPLKVPTYYANSPSGLLPEADCFTTQPPKLGAFDTTPKTTTDAAGVTTTDAGPSTGVPTLAKATDIGVCDTGIGLAKFVDTLPIVKELFPSADPASPTIPIAKADKNTYKGSDYYEIAVVEYTQRMHRDLAKETTLRGYVQIDPSGKGEQLYYPKLDATGNKVAIMLPNGKPATAVAAPSYLGPILNSTTGTPTRIKFYNLLPAGTEGNLRIPVDETITGAGVGPDGTSIYQQNRVEIHLHGGDNPWISDGTPHQWILPAADETRLSSSTDPNIKAMARGVGAKNVPDMPDPGPGAMTYYFPNGESSRLMFYHDHAIGITRLNVYAGIAAGYLLNDKAGVGENHGKDPVTGNVTTGSLVDILDGIEQIPLVIQDKTFVPKNIGIQDAKWDSTAWGQEGDLWYPHVYETNQDPNSFDGTNPVGRWDWGSWFWPVFPSTFALPSGEAVGTLYNIDGTIAKTNVSQVTTTPEAFMDTAVVNGKAYPTLTVEPKLYRFRVLNGANDRFLNLGLYLAADKNTTDGNNPLNPAKMPTLCDGSTPRPNGNTIVGAGLVPAATDCTEVKMVNFDVSYTPTDPHTADGTKGFPTTGGIVGTGWGTQVGSLMPQGVPDPATAGPHIVQIGNEGGLIANPLDIPSTPLNYEFNRRSVTVLNVMERGLYLGNAERADVLVDFSKYAGKTLILFNDAPAPVPAADPRIDYYTGNGDNTGVGGAPNVKPGYGPNTRTIMQFVVKSAVTGTSAKSMTITPATDTTPTSIKVGTADLQTALSSAYASSQAKPIVPEPEFNTAFPGISPATRTDARIWTGAIYQNKLQGLTFTTPEEINYFPAPTCTSATLCATEITKQKDPATAVAPAGTTLVTSPSITGLVKAPAGTKINAYVQNKAIQELFEPAHGRMNATLGIELPFTTAITQTTIPLAFVDPATEIVADGETQFWKITHNGVDTHPVHFHLVNVEVINRIGWDGTVKQPYGDEIGWKETVKMNPLEDIVVAVRAKKPSLQGVAIAQADGSLKQEASNAFGLPLSLRLRDPSQKEGTQIGFTQVDPATGFPAAVSNKMDNYGWEYVWHCHILGHEENDFMRPVVFNANEAAAAQPIGLGITTTPAGTGTDNKIVWQDQATTEYQYMVQRALVTNGTTGAYAANLDLAAMVLPADQLAGSAPLANANTFTDKNVPALPAVKATANPKLTTPTGTNLIANAVNLSWTTVANAGSYTVDRAPAGTTTFVPLGIATVNGSTASFADTTVAPSTTYVYRVTAISNQSNAYSYKITAVGANGNGVNEVRTSPVLGANGVATLNVTTPIVVNFTAPNTLTAAVNATNNGIALSWKDNSNNENSFTVWRSVNGAPATLLTTVTSTAANVTAINRTVTYNDTTAVAGGSTYSYYVLANKTTAPAGISAPSNTATFTIPAPMVATPSNLTATATGTTVALRWTDNSNNEGNFTVWRSVNNAPATLLTTVTSSAANATAINRTVTYSNTGLAPGSTYAYYVIANKTTTFTGASAQSTPATVTIASAPAAPTAIAVSIVRPTPTSRTDNATVTWVDNATNETGFTVQRATNATFTAGLTTLPAVAANATTVTQTGLRRGTTYFYRVASSNGGILSTWNTVATTGTVAP